MTTLGLSSILPFTIKKQSTEQQGPIVSSKLTAGTVVKPAVIKKAKRVIKSDWLKFRIIANSFLVVAIVGLAIFYATGVNGYAAKGYEIRKLQANVNQKIEENKKAAVQLAGQSSILEISAVAQQANLVQVTEEEYLQQSASQQLSKR